MPIFHKETLTNIIINNTHIRYNGVVKSFCRENNFIFLFKDVTDVYINDQNYSCKKIIINLEGEFKVE